MLWGISLAVTQVSWLRLQFPCPPLVGMFFLLSSWNNPFIFLIFCRFSSNVTRICFIIWFDRADNRAARWAPVPSAWGWKCSSTWARKMHWWTVSCPSSLCLAIPPSIETTNASQLNLTLTNPFCSNNMLAPWSDHPILFDLWQMQDYPNTGANSRCAPFWWATKAYTMGTLLSSLCPLFISYMLSRVDFTIFFLLQPLAQSLEDLDLVSQQVSASVSEVTLARDEKAEVL